MKRPACRIRRSQPGKGGFTLVELLVAIAIVMVLAALAFVVIRSSTASAHRATCVNIMRQYGLAMNGYLGDNHNMLPSIQVNLQKPFYRHPTDHHIFAKMYPYLGLERQSKPTALPDELVCPAWRKRFPNWNSDGTGTVAGNAYFMNQDQSVNGRRIYGTQSNQSTQYGPMSYAVVANGTEKTPASRILFLADGHHPTEKIDPVHGKRRSYLFLDFHVESLPADQVELFISP